MRKIKNFEWDIVDKEGKPTGKKESLVDALDAITLMKKPEQMPRGLDKTRMFNRLVKAFDKAKKDGIIVLEESDYSFLKEGIEKDAPALWGKNDDLMKALEAFMESKQEK